MMIYDNPYEYGLFQSSRKEQLERSALKALTRRLITGRGSFLTNLLQISSGSGADRSLKPLVKLRTLSVVTGGNGGSTSGKVALRSIARSTSLKWTKSVCALEEEHCYSKLSFLKSSKAGDAPLI